MSEFKNNFLFQVHRLGGGKKNEKAKFYYGKLVTLIAWAARQLPLLMDATKVQCIEWGNATVMEIAVANTKMSYARPRDAANWYNRAWWDDNRWNDFIATAAWRATASDFGDSTLHATMTPLSIRPTFIHVCHQMVYIWRLFLDRSPIKNKSSSQLQSAKLIFCFAYSSRRIVSSSEIFITRCSGDGKSLKARKSASL